MAQLHKTVAALRIIGDTLEPEEISKILRCTPTSSFKKGQVVRGANSGREHTKKSGMWTLDADDQQPSDLDLQIKSIVDRLPNDLGIWHSLSTKFQIDLFCGFFMETTDEGLEISSECLCLLGERSISFGFCIYAPLSED